MKNIERRVGDLERGSAPADGGAERGWEFLEWALKDCWKAAIRCRLPTSENNLSGWAEGVLADLGWGGMEGRGSVAVVEGESAREVIVGPTRYERKSAEWQRCERWDDEAVLTIHCGTGTAPVVTDAAQDRAEAKAWIENLERGLAAREAS